jgi:hypothetical protein
VASYNEGAVLGAYPVRRARAVLLPALAIAAVLAPAGAAGRGGPLIRRAFFRELEARALGEPDRTVEVLVRIRAAGAGAHMRRSHAGLVADAAPELHASDIEARRSVMARASRALPGELASGTRPRAGEALSLLAPPAGPVVLDTLWAARCLVMRLPAASIGALLAHPEVDGVFENVTLQALPPGEIVHRVSGAPPAVDADRAGRTQAIDTGPVVADSWAHARIRTVQARQQFRVDGTGVVLGHIDSGVDDSHPALAGSVVRFLDLVGGRPRPYDDAGHGTHTAGTMVGRMGVGMAPGARLVVAKALDRGGRGTLVNLLKAMQWMLDPDGDPRTTADRPAAVNNSWGVRREDARLEGFEDTLFWETVRVWRAAGILPIFSAGNARAGEVLLPGAYPVNLAVAATDQADRVPEFSSSGRVDWHGWAFYKPDLCAPGVEIPSCYPGARTAWISGTSMACPHVTGLVALSTQLAPAIPVRERERILMDACTDIGSPGRGQRSGEGRIDARKTLELTAAYRPPATPPGGYAPVYTRARRFRVAP